MQNQKNQRKNMAQVKFQVAKMACGRCQARVQKAIESVKGVSCAVVDLDGAQAEVDYDPAKTTVDAIKKAVVGVTKADKTQIQKMVQLILSLESIPAPDHAADALGAAICAAMNTNGSNCYA